MEPSTSINVLFEPGQISASQAVERLAAVGFGRLDFNFCDWCFVGSLFVSEDWEDWVRGVRRRADELGVRFTQAHSRVVRQRNLDWFAELLHTAEGTGVGLALENVNDLAAHSRGARRFYGSTPAELVDLVDGFGGGNVGICWDTGHAHIQRLDQPAALRAVGGRLKALHVQDNNGRSDQHLLPYSVPPGQGIDWPSLVLTLREIAYEGDLTLEVAQAIGPLPDPLRDSAMRHALQIARHLAAM